MSTGSANGNHGYGDVVGAGLAAARLLDHTLAKASRRTVGVILQLNGQPMDLDEQQRETYAAMPEDARQKLICHNLRLVSHIAGKYTK